MDCKTTGVRLFIFKSRYFKYLHGYNGRAVKTIFLFIHTTLTLVVTIS